MIQDPNDLSTYLETWTEPMDIPVPPLTPMTEELFPIILMNLRIFLCKVRIDLLRYEHQFRTLATTLQEKAPPTIPAAKRKTLTNKILATYAVFRQLRLILLDFEGTNLINFLKSRKLNQFWPDDLALEYGRLTEFSPGLKKMEAYHDDLLLELDISYVHLAAPPMGLCTTFSLNPGQGLLVPKGSPPLILQFSRQHHGPYQHPLLPTAPLQVLPLQSSPSTTSTDAVVPQSKTTATGTKRAASGASSAPPAKTLRTSSPTDHLLTEQPILRRALTNVMQDSRSESPALPATQEPAVASPIDLTTGPPTQGLTGRVDRLSNQPDGHNGPITRRNSKKSH